MAMNYLEDAADCKPEDFKPAKNAGEGGSAGPNDSVDLDLASGMVVGESKGSKGPAHGDGSAKTGVSVDLAEGQVSPNVEEDRD